MTTPSIGSYQFLSMRGTPVDQPGMVLEQLTRPGHDGCALRELGKRATPVRIITKVDEASHAACQITLQGYKDLQGTIVTVVDEADNTWSFVAVLEVRPLRIFKPVALVGVLINSGTWVLMVEWILLSTNV